MSDKFGKYNNRRFPQGSFAKASQNKISPRETSMEDRARLHGCGDPDCLECNYDVAKNRPNARYPDQPLGGGAVARPNPLTALEERLIEYALSNGTMSGFEKPSSVPSAYTSARKKVEQWIVTADETSFDDIKGNSSALAQLRDAIEAPVVHKDLYEAYGLAMPKGALLEGPPGCGKTMFARAAATEMKRLYPDAEVEFLSLSGSAIQTPIVGETEKIIRNIFAFAREYLSYKGHPLLIFIDEAEVILPDRSGNIRPVAPWEESQVAAFLTEMDGVVASGAFVLIASNQPHKIDQALLRDGRCDFKIKVERPDNVVAEEILRKCFASTLTKTSSPEELTQAALECFFDPFKVIATAHAIQQAMDGKLTTKGKDFTLADIVSGAMLTGLPLRASRIAFARDKAESTITGVTVADVIAAVNTIFEENQGLNHSYAQKEFIRAFAEEIETPPANKLN